VAQRMTPGRALLGLYLLFVVAAGARSIVQLATHPGRAPLAYALSLGAAVVYAVGFGLVRRVERGADARPLTACSVVELGGVLAVGTLSLLDRGAFPDATVWSDYGAGYLLVPLALPLLVLCWLRRREAPQPASATMGRCPRA
jgi:drug/metabolite transporter (DMT)-like permease